jgi:putative transposase
VGVLVMGDRRSIRLAGYDYSQAGVHFVTICTYQRKCLFGEIVDRQMLENSWGKVVKRCLESLADHFPQVLLDAHVIMPNHVHAIVSIGNISDVDEPKEKRRLESPSKDGFPHQRINHVAPVGAQHAAPLSKSTNVVPGSLGAVIRSFKSAVTKELSPLRQHIAEPLWQRNYYEHIIRSETSFRRIQEYILNNPANWAEAKNDYAKKQNM